MWIRRHTFDLIITRQSETVLVGTPVPDYLFSDHYSILYDLTFPKPTLSVNKVAYRKISAVDIEQFRYDISASDLGNCDLNHGTPDDLDCFADSYDRILRDILDHHAPVKTNIITERPRIPWFNVVIRKAKKERRKSERKWRRTELQYDYDWF